MSAKHTVQTTREKNAQERAEKRARRERRERFEDRIYAELPPELPNPTISNESETAFFGKPGLWLSFHRDYGEIWSGSWVLSELEKAGFVPIPSTLCKWDNYRPSTEPGQQSDIPEKGKGCFGRPYTLTDSWPLCPLHIRPEQHTGSDAIAYYRSPSGLVVKVLVPAPSGVYLTARRREFPGGWRYESGSARIGFPESWHSINLESGECVALLESPRAYVDTEQGISGALYWAPVAHEQNEFPLTPAQMLAILEK